MNTRIPASAHTHTHTPTPEGPRKPPDSLQEGSGPGGPIPAAPPGSEAVTRLLGVSAGGLGGGAPSSALGSPGSVASALASPGSMLGEKLAAVRKTRGLTQAQVAGLLGCHRMTIQGWEVGRVTPPLRTLRKLAELYERTLVLDLVIADDEFDELSPVTIDLEQ